jgi:hypothetical protein
VERRNLFTDCGRALFIYIGNNYTIADLQSNTAYCWNNSVFQQYQAAGQFSTPISKHTAVSLRLIYFLSRRTASVCVVLVHPSIPWLEIPPSSGATVSASSRVQHDHPGIPIRCLTPSTAYGWISENGTYDGNKFWKIYRGQSRQRLTILDYPPQRMDSNQMPYYSVAASYVSESISSTNNLNWCGVLSGGLYKTDRMRYLLDTKPEQRHSAIMTVYRNTRLHRYYRL